MEDKVEQALALASALEKIELYIPTVYKNDGEPDLDEDNLNHAENGIMRVTTALNNAIDVIQALEAGKINVANIINDLFSTDPDSVLSGAMGRQLKEYIDQKIGMSSIVNNLLSTDIKSVLAGPMGKQLKDELDRLNSDMAGIKFKEIALPVGSTIESDLLKFNTTDFGISGVGVNYIVRTFTGFDSFIIGNISSSNNYGSQLLVKDSDIIKYRSKYDGAWGDWKQLAFK